jgi:hypothetical protein
MLCLTRSSTFAEVSELCISGVPGTWMVVPGPDLSDNISHVEIAQRGVLSLGEFYAISTAPPANSSVSWRVIHPRRLQERAVLPGIFQDVARRLSLGEYALGVQTSFSSIIWEGGSGSSPS